MVTVGFTGSSGKTTVSWLVRGILEQLEQLTGMIGSLEYALAEHRMDMDGDAWVASERDPTEGRSSTQPFFLAPYRGKYRTWSNTPPGLHMQKLMEGMRGRGATAVLVEASDMALEQGWLDWTEITVGVFTNHLMVDTAPEDVAGCAEILDIEMSLLRKLTDPSKQSLVMNLDVHESVMRAAKGAARGVPMVTYSLRNQNAMVWLQSVSSTIWETELQVRTPGGVLQIITPLLGEHNMYNVLAAVATGLALKAPLPAIVAGIEAVEVIPGRCEIIDEGQQFSVIVDSCSTPAALGVLLDTLRPNAKRILLVIGASGSTDPAMRPILAQVAHEKSDLVIFTNDSPATEDPAEIISDLMAGLPDDIVNPYSGYVYFPFQDQGHCPLWFEPYLQKAQRDCGRYVMEDRFSAIRAAIGTAQIGDVVVIAGRGAEDLIEHSDGNGNELFGWFDDRVECRDALSKLQYLYTLTDLRRNVLPWGEGLDAMETVLNVGDTY
ncbi:MAG: hypothetical protein WDW36_002742 [Sanguina aurantia]